MEEKKLTDEEIAKAILQSIEYSKTLTYFDEWGNCKSIMITDVIDLIHRLQNESQKQYEDNCLLEAENSVLRQENENLRIDNDDLREERQNMSDVIFELEHEKMVLQSADEEQKAEIERLTKKSGTCNHLRERLS